MIQGSDISVAMYKEIEKHMLMGLPSDKWVLGRKLLREPLPKKANTVIVLFRCPPSKSKELILGEFDGSLHDLLDHVVTSPVPDERRAFERHMDNRADTKGTMMWFVHADKNAKRITKKVVWVY